MSRSARALVVSMSSQSAQPLQLPLCTPLRPAIEGDSSTCVGTQAAEARQDTAVVLVHSFGGGSFSWRLIMQSLADRCGQRVIALDRPGFGAAPAPGFWE